MYPCVCLIILELNIYFFLKIISILFINISICSFPMVIVFLSWLSFPMLFLWVLSLCFFDHQLAWAKCTCPSMPIFCFISFVLDICKTPLSPAFTEIRRLWIFNLICFYAHRKEPSVPRNTNWNVYSYLQSIADLCKRKFLSKLYNFYHALSSI